MEQFRYTSHLLKEDSSTKSHDNVLEFINIIKNSFVGSTVVYTEGSCYRFYEILKFVFPNAKPYIVDEGHIVTKIGDNFYDITGIVEGKFELFDYNYIKNLRTEMIYEEITSNRFHFQVDYLQCPHCDDIIKIK